MSTRSLDAQRSYVKKMKKRGFDFSLIVADAFIRGIRDIGYKSTATAFDELIDNSIQADASNILIVYQFGERSNKPESIAIIDDGHGMEPEMIRLAMVWGGTHRENNREGFGRYGYGLPSAAVSQARRYEVYSVVDGGEWHKGWLDLDEVAAGRYTSRAGNINVPKPKPTRLPDWIDRPISVYFDEGVFRHGTVIVLDKLDRTDWKTDAGLDRNLMQHIGVTYRNFLPDVKVVVNGKNVDPIDPLFLTPEAAHYAVDADRAEALPEAVIPVRDKTERKQLWDVRVRFAYFPPTFARANKSKPATKTNRNPRYAVLNDHMGLIVCRNGRQIDVINKIPGTKIVNDDRYWGVEIDFPAGLDEEFAITTSKQQITLSPRIWEILKQAGVFQAIATLRRRYYEESKRQIAQSEVRSEKRASEFAMEDSGRFLHLREESAEKQQLFQQRLEEEAHRRAAESGRPVEQEIAQLTRETDSTPFRVEYESRQGAPFYRVDQIGGQRLLYLNTSHPFFTRLYGGREAGPRTRAALEVLLFTIGSCELGAIGDRQLFYETERVEWSRMLNIALRQLEHHIGR